MHYFLKRFIISGCNLKCPHNIHLHDKRKNKKLTVVQKKKTFLFGATVTLWFGDLIWCHLLAKMIVGKHNLSHLVLKVQKYDLLCTNLNIEGQERKKDMQDD